MKASWELTFGKVSAVMLPEPVRASACMRDEEEFWRAGGQRMSSWEPIAGKASVVLNTHYRTCILTRKHDMMVKCECLCALNSAGGQHYSFFWGLQPHNVATSMGSDTNSAGGYSYATGQLLTGTMGCDRHNWDNYMNTKHTGIRLERRKAARGGEINISKHCAIGVRLTRRKSVARAGEET